MIITPLQANIEAGDHLVIKAVVDQFEVLIQEAEVRNPNTTNNHFRIRDFTDAYNHIAQQIHDLSDTTQQHTLHP